jgi:Flp pilus assembly protein TadG
VPALVVFVVGIAELGILFMANAGLRNAVAEGARYATIYPRPSDAQIRQRITDTRFG